MTSYDIAVIGGGIAGATAACHIAPTHSVALLEQERELAYHTTSRSAAIYLEHDGGFAFRRLNRAGREFLHADHPELDAPLLDPLPVLSVGDESDRAGLTQQVEEGAELDASVRLLDADEMLAMCPVLRPDVVTVGMLEPGAASLDVMALHQLYVRRAVAHGAEVRRASRVTAMTPGADGGFTLTTATGAITAGKVVNAAGAWGDGVARMAGVEPVGLTPMRRTAFTTTVAVDPRPWPFIYAGGHELTCYFKPEAGRQLLCSLADETPSEPCDARAEELDVALAIDHLNALTTLGIRSVNTTWAGLRTFAPDRAPVFGPDQENETFIWLVGQGGWGICSSPAAGLVAGAAARGDPFPATLAELGLTAAHLQPRR